MDNSQQAKIDIQGILLGSSKACLVSIAANTVDADKPRLMTQDQVNRLDSIYEELLKLQEAVVHGS